MMRTLIAAVAVLGLSPLVLVAQPAFRHGDEVKPVVQTEECFVHCLTGVFRRDGLFEAWEKPGVTLIMTWRRSGDMRVLATTGAVGYRTRRMTFSEKRLVGLLARKDHLYLAYWEARSYDVPPRSILEKPDNDQAGLRETNALKAGFCVEVHDLKSGKIIGQTTFSDSEGPKALLPATPPQETWESGVFGESDGKVIFYGASVTVEGDTLTWADGPQDAPD